MTENERYVRVLFEPRDLWIGAYIKEPYWEGGYKVQDIYICIIPTLPILISWRRRGDW